MELFSKEVLEKWKDIDPTGWQNIVRDILDAFEKASNDQLTAFRNALSNKDHRLTYLYSHSLKSSYGNVGALFIQSQFAIIEKMVELKEVEFWNHIQTQFKVLESNLPETLRLIDEFKTSLPKN